MRTAPPYALHNHPLTRPPPPPPLPPHPPPPTPRPPHHSPPHLRDPHDPHPPRPHRPHPLRHPHGPPRARCREPRLSRSSSRMPCQLQIPSPDSSPPEPPRPWHAPRQPRAAPVSSPWRLTTRTGPAPSPAARSGCSPAGEATVGGPVGGLPGLAGVRTVGARGVITQQH